MPVRCGIAGWIDKSLIDSKLLYPMAVTSAEERLSFYASQFSVVEAGTTYYGMPKPENSERWAARTPPGFLFDVKSFSLLTNHPTKATALPPDLRAELPDNLREKNLYVDQLPAELVDEAWERFRDGLEPLVTARVTSSLFRQPAGYPAVGSGGSKQQEAADIPPDRAPAGHGGSNLQRSGFDQEPHARLVVRSTPATANQAFTVVQVRRRILDLGRD